MYGTRWSGDGGLEEVRWVKREKERMSRTDSGQQKTTTANSIGFFSRRTLSEYRCLPGPAPNRGPPTLTSLFRPCRSTIVAAYYYPVKWTLIPSRQLPPLRLNHALHNENFTNTFTSSSTTLYTRIYIHV